MTTPFGTRGHTKRPFTSPSGLWDAFDSVRTEFDRRTTPRMGRGDVRVAVLTLLAEEPMHGYQIIREIDDRSGGTWKPSPGSVYPTLQLLADEGLILAHESEGKKTYTLTDKGRTEVQGSRPAPWEDPAAHSSARPTALPQAAAKLAEAVLPIMRSGSAEQIDAAVAVVDDARRKLYGILAKD